MTTTTAPTGAPETRLTKRDPWFWRLLKSPRFARALFPLAVLAFWLVALQIIDAVWDFSSTVLPTPSEVWDFMWREITADTLAPRNVYETFAISLRRLGIGFAVSMVLGTLIGLAMGLWKSADAFFHDWVMALLAMPALAWALFLSLVFGFGDRGPVYAVVLAGIPFVIVNVREGVRNAPRDLFDMARSFQVPQAKITWHVLLPSLMPFLFAAARYAFSIGWKGLVITEVFGGQDGSGWTIKFWYDAHQAHGVVGYAFFFVIFALFIEKAILDPLSHRVFRWRPSLDGPEVVEEAFAEAGAVRPQAGDDK